MSDPSSTKAKKGRKRNQCDIPDERRCKRSDKKKDWRCRNARVNHGYCQHHADLAAKNYSQRKERRNQVPTSSSVNKPKEGKEAFPMDTSQVVGISEKEMNNVGRTIDQEIRIASEKSDLYRLSLITEDRNEELTSDERDGLCALRYLLSVKEKKNPDAALKKGKGDEDF